MNGLKTNLGGVMLKQLLEEERNCLNFFFDHIDVKSAESIFSLLLQCQGVLFFTGIGKSSLVAKKIAMTMTSTGSRALYLSATNALHGDLGIVSPQDIFILFSKSGESEELLQLIPSLRNRGVKTVAVVSKAGSRLSKACDYEMVLPLTKEICPFGLAPTTSTVIQLIFGDVLTIALMQAKKFGLDEYASNHPAGNIGKRASLKVKDLMLRQEALPICSSEDRVMDILVELSNKRCGCVLVVNPQGELEGIFTDGDLGRSLKNCGTQALETPLKFLMTKQPKWIGPDELAWQAMQLMEADQKNAITVLPVLDKEHKVQGLIKMHDLLQSGL